MNSRNFFAELKRRNVYKVAIAYAVVGWLVIQISSTVLPTFHAPEWVLQTLLVLVAIGFPIALVIAWAFELTPEGIKRAEDVDLAASARQPRKHTWIFVVIADPSGGKFIPAERHKTLYADAQLPRRPNYAKSPKDKPSLLRQIGDLPPLGPKTVTDDETIRNRLRMLASVEDGIADIFKTLENQKQLDNTLIIFTSDEGYFYGEHGLSVERRLAYEESIRIPLFMRWPKLIRAGSAVDQCALNIDIAPTLLDIGGAPPPKEIHGRSLVPLLRGEKVPWRDSFLIEYFSDKVFPRMSNMGYQAIREGRWKYIHYVDLDRVDELYDLKADAYEMNNLAPRSEAAGTVGQMRAKLAQLLDSSK